MSRGKKTNPLQPIKRSANKLNFHDNELGIENAIAIIGQDPAAVEYPQGGLWSPETVDRHYWELHLDLLRANSKVKRRLLAAVQVWVQGKARDINNGLHEPGIVEVMYGRAYDFEYLPIDHRVFQLAAAIAYLDPDAALFLLGYASSKLNDKRFSDLKATDISFLYQLKQSLEISPYQLSMELSSKNTSREPSITAWEAIVQTETKACQELINYRHKVLAEYREKLWDLMQGDDPYQAYQLANVLMSCSYARHVIPNIVRVRQRLADKAFPGLAKHKPKK